MFSGGNQNTEKDTTKKPNAQKEETLKKLFDTPKVIPQNLFHKEILKIEYFEYFYNPFYNPIILRILLNSINIFNYKYDEPINIITQEKNFPISIQKVKGKKKDHLIMHVITEVDILNELLLAKDELFNDFKTEKTIDYKLEKSSKGNKEKYEIHRNYFDGLNFERNCIKKFFSYINRDKVTILPHIFFYIKDDKYALEIASRLGIKYSLDIPKSDNSISDKEYYGYNEIDLFIEFKENAFLIQPTIKDFFLVKYFKDGISEFIPQFKFNKDKRYIFEIKLSSFDVTEKVLNKTLEKGEIIQQSLLSQKYIEKEKEIVVVIIADLYEQKLRDFKKPAISNEIFLIYADISVNYSTFMYMNDEIKQLKESSIIMEQRLNRIEEILSMTHSEQNLKLNLKSEYYKKEKEIISLAQKFGVKEEDSIDFQNALRVIILS